MKGRLITMMRKLLSGPQEKTTPITDTSKIVVSGGNTSPIDAATSELLRERVRVQLQAIDYEISRMRR